jgi:hypothetical protein
MVTEIARKYGYKRIRVGSQVNDHDTGDGIKIPVITEITFRDPVQRGQETTHTIDNRNTGWRDVHYAFVGPKGSPNAKEGGIDTLVDQVPGDCALVERLEVLRFRDQTDRGQETFPELNNSPESYDPHGPPYFTQHLKTHVVKFWNDPTDQNSGTAAEVELIDELLVKDPVEQGQETHYFLQNPQDDAAANAQLLDESGNPRTDLEDLTRTDVQVGEVDPPYRFDPFQNLIHINGYYVMFLWLWSDYTYSGFDDVGLLQLGGTFPSNVVTMPGEDGWGVTNNMKVDMVGDSGNPLSDASPVNNSKNNGTDPQPVPHGPPDDISHTINACGWSNTFGFSQGNWSYPEACPLPPEGGTLDPSLRHYVTTGTTFPGKTYYSTWLFMANPTTPPADDATDAQKETYKPMAFRVRTTDMLTVVPDRYYGADLTSVNNAQVPRIHYLRGPGYPFLQLGIGGIAVMVFKGDNIELKLEDKIRPIRAKDDKGNVDTTQYGQYDNMGGFQFQTEYDNWVSSLKKVAQSVTWNVLNTYLDPPGADANDAYNHVTHDYKAGWQNNTPSEWRFEMLTLQQVVPSSPPGKPMPIVWPVNPAAFPNPIPPDHSGDPPGMTLGNNINTYWYTTIDKDNVFQMGTGQTPGDADRPFNFGDPPIGGRSAAETA